MNTAYLLIGGNIGDRKQYLFRAVNELNKQCGQVLKTSAIYETEAWGMKEQQSFLNQALEVYTPLTAVQLLLCVLKIEEKLGRKREIKYGPRTLDIDLLFFNNEIINTPTLTIPHPEIPNRRFALQCLNEIAPQKMHPVLHKTIQQLLNECPDRLKVEKFEEKNKL